MKKNPLVEDTGGDTSGVSVKRYKSSSVSHNINFVHEKFDVCFSTFNEVVNKTLDVRFFR